MVLWMRFVTPLMYGSVTTPLFFIRFVGFFIPLLFGISSWLVLPIGGIDMFFSNVLSSRSIIIVARLYNVLTTDSLCVVGCSDVHKRCWSVCVGFLWIFILMYFYI